MLDFFKMGSADSSRFDNLSEEDGNMNMIVDQFDEELIMVHIKMSIT